MGSYDEAVSVLGGDSQQADYELLQRRALYKRRSSQRDLRGAESDLRSSLQLNPYDPEGLGLLGGVLRRQGLLSEALECYVHAGQLSPSSIYFKVATAELALMLGDVESSLAQYSTLLQTICGSASPDGMSQWDSLVAAEAAFVLGRDAEATAHLDQAFRLSAGKDQLNSLREQLASFVEIGWRQEAGKTLIGAIDTARQAKESASLIASHRTVQIVHISDIHFGFKTAKKGKHGQLQGMHYFPDDDENTPSLRETFVADLVEQLRNHRLDIDQLVLVVSGDFVYRERADEFQNALDFLIGVCEDIGLQREYVILAPGNHDVNWDAAENDPSSRMDDYLNFVRAFYGDTLYRARFPHIAEAIADGAKHVEPRDIISVVDLFGFGFVGLNTNVFEDDKRHFGFVGGRQLRAVERDVQSMLPSGTPIIAVMHHHLHPYPEMLAAPKQGDVWLDGSIVRDSGLVEKTLAALGTVLVLHGHKHKAQVRETVLVDRHTQAKRPQDCQIVVNGAGSLGVAKSELEDDEAHQYAVIEVNWESMASYRINVTWRELGLWAGAHWIRSASWEFTR